MSEIVRQDSVRQSPASATLPALEDWRSKTIGFRYSLSYVKLFEINFKALEDPRPFDPTGSR